jgi:hypothetical protein
MIPETVFDTEPPEPQEPVLPTNIKNIPYNRHKKKIKNKKKIM